MLCIDHVGYAVKDIIKAKEEFIRLGFTFTDIIPDTDRNINILFGKMDGLCVELVETIDTEMQSPVKDILKKNGPTSYHICYQSDDIENDIEQLKKKKYVVIIPLAGAAAFGGKRIVFMLNRHIGMIELVEK